MTKEEIEVILENHKQAIYQMLEISQKEDAIKLEKIKVQHELLKAKELVRDIIF
jgi:hypothetical protein